MLAFINTLLLPIEQFIISNRKYFGYFFIFLSFLTLGYLFFPNSVKDSGEQAILVLWILLWLPIFSRVFGITLAQAILPLRKEIGILMWMLAFVHSARYIIGYPEYVLDPGFWFQDGFLTYLAFWFFSLVLTLPLLLTSNNWAIRKLWRNWKRIHRFVYLVLILTIVHVVLINYSREFEIGPVIIMIIYFILKWLEWKWVKFYKEEEKEFPLWQKWLCVPCGYIYDPLIGDDDSGILPGTEFVDIPNNWTCSVCWVSKADFIPFTNEELPTKWAKINEIISLNKTTIELVIETDEPIMSIPGQFVGFSWTDGEWNFQRSYSIVEQLWNFFKFTIKLDPFGRWARLLKEIKAEKNIRITGVFGNFILKDTSFPKIFIATWTWLAPIYNMIVSLPGTVKKVLYFSVATQAELFYVDKLRNIENLELHIHVTREQVEWFESGRVDVDLIETPLNSEWYLCGNPKMVAEAREKLSKNGFQHIYSEEF